MFGLLRRPAFWGLTIMKQTYIQVKDIADVWFDSASTNAFVLGRALIYVLLIYI